MNVLRRLAYRSLASIAIKKSKYCVICKNHFGFFLPYRNRERIDAPLMNALETIGSDVKNFSCPRCGCHDRERHLHLYMQALGLYDLVKGSKVLHFAPERRLAEQIKNCQPELYFMADLYPSSKNVRKVDMLDMPFEDNSFEFIIANHVMEHVDDFSKALEEIYRVLQKGGYAILQTPYSNKLVNTFYDPGIDTDYARLQAYGQEDHVRLFGKNIFEVFSASGLENRVHHHQEILKGIDSKKYGVNPKEPLFLFHKANT